MEIILTRALHNNNAGFSTCMPPEKKLFPRFKRCWFISSCAEVGLLAVAGTVPPFDDDDDEFCAFAAAAFAAAIFASACASDIGNK